MNTNDIFTEIDYKADGYVVEIPDNYSVVINVGIDDGYTIGDKFEIYEPGHVITDSITKEDIGRLDHIKDVVTIQQIDDNISLCKKTKKVKAASPIKSMSSLLEGSIVEKNVELNVNQDEVKNWEFNPSPIKINDFVKKVEY